MSFEKVEDAMQHFISLQSRFVEAKKAVTAIEDKLEEDIEILKGTMEQSAEYKAAKEKLKESLEKYKAETKAYFGVCDGETINIPQVADMVIRIHQRLKAQG